MPTLTLRRATFAFGALRSVIIEIDGASVTRLSYGEKKTFELPAGTHQFVAKMDWCGSAPLSLALVENEQRSILIEGIPLLQAFLMVFIPPFVIFTLREETSASSS